MAERELQRPAFVESSELLARAFDYAYAAHEGPASTGKTEISHPVAVAEILAEAGFSEQVTAAALLHDVLEDTGREGEELSGGFPAEVGRLVEVMTEDPSIDDYAERKAEHRGRVLAAGDLPASIYLADKLARARRYRADGEPVAAQRLAHYRTTLASFAEADPALPFLEELSEELPRLEAEPED